MLGRFLEISLPTADIRASVEFYERLGFTHCTAGDVWSHPYGVLTDGRIVLGLHGREMPGASITFVMPDLAARLPQLEARGIDFEARLGSEVFNEIAFSDPGGQRVTILEARTYSPSRRAPGDLPECGEFAAFSLPARDIESCARFWEALGFVALEPADAAPWPQLALTSDHLELALHSPRLLDCPALVFCAPDMEACIGRLRERGLAPTGRLRGLEESRNALFEAPEGTALLLLSAA